jgi:hypothetical protein
MTVGFAILLAQSGATDQTARQITILITALLAVALLLAASTVWYWRHTDPRRRNYRPATSDHAESAEQRRQVLPLEPEVLAETYAEDDGVTVDEWLSLTGPDALKRN